MIRGLLNTITFLDLTILGAVIAASVAAWRHRARSLAGVAQSVGWPLSLGIGCLTLVAIIALFATQIPVSALRGVSALAASSGIGPIAFRIALASMAVVLCVVLLRVSASASHSLDGSGSDAPQTRDSNDVDGGDNEKNVVDTRGTPLREHMLNSLRLQAFLRTFADWIWESDANGLLTMSNGQCLAALGYERDELLGTDRLLLCHPDEVEEFRKHIERARTQGQGWQDWPVRLRHRNGTYHRFESSVMPLHAPGGEFVGLVGIDRDVTERLLLEQALEDAIAANAGLAKDYVAIDSLEAGAGSDESRYPNVVGNSAALRRCLEQVSRAGPSGVPVLILGETGTGKELVAHALHQSSTRSSAPMFSLNCATLPADLVEAELFGHEKGSFTGAFEARKGLFEAADGGTLFLDEIGDLPLHLQSKLLRVLDDGCFRRVGGTETIRTDVRLLSATNRNLDKAVAAGEFRSDLYYRINTVTIRLPPLRERPEDIPDLTRYFVAKHGARLNREVVSVSAGLLRQMQRRNWPGNVRELENFVERCLIASDQSVLQAADADVWWLRGTDEDFDAAESDGINLAAAVAEFERRQIRQVLEACDWVIDGPNGAAARLGMPPGTLRYKMKKLGTGRGPDDDERGDQHSPAE